MWNGELSGVKQQGMTYVAILFFIAIAGAVLATTAEVWSQQRLRSREQELLWIGSHFSQAIEQYYQHSPGTVKRYPGKLEDLLEDHRHLAVTRYLRKIYRDPMTGEARWGIVTAPQGGIMGVYSLSDEEPIKRAGFAERQDNFNGSRHYSDWRFVYVETE